MHRKLCPVLVDRKGEASSEAELIESIFTGKRILAADDAEIMRHLLRLTFQPHGSHVEAVHNGKEVLAKADEAAPDLLILDIEMPIMDGFETATLLRKDPRYATTPILALTSLEYDEFWGDPASCHFNAYMRKPATIGNLVEVADLLLTAASEQKLMASFEADLTCSERKGIF